MKTMKIIRQQVAHNKKLREDVFLLSFISSFMAQKAAPGQFLHIKVRGSTILRRPISIHAVKGEHVFLLFRVRGRGTQELSTYKPGDTLDILGPLGNGFTLPSAIKRVSGSNILIGGGMGAAPLVFLAQYLQNQRLKAHARVFAKNQPQNLVILGGKTKNDIVCQKEFKKYGCSVVSVTEDGSSGSKGVVTDMLTTQMARLNTTGNIRVYACGPNAMLLAVHQVAAQYQNSVCQVSFEQFMGCGTGICCGCTIHTKNGFKKCCQDGPVFNSRDIW